MQETALLELRGICKFFPGVRALDGVDFTLRKGEIHALMGENGAGKSTLIKVLTGVYSEDEGTISMEGTPVQYPHDAGRAQGGHQYGLSGDHPLPESDCGGESAVSAGPRAPLPTGAR